MAIKYLKIERYRGVESFEWWPSPGINALIGPGDVGKTTILEAISLLLNPSPGGFASEYDYYRRRVEAGFEVTAVIGDLSVAATRTFNPSCLLGWKDNKVAGLPDEDDAEPIIVARVRASPDLELAYELLHADDSTEFFTVASRKAFQLAEIAPGARAMSEMRLNRGSLLERHVKSAGLRPTISRNIATASEAMQLPQEISQSVEALSKTFQSHGLPADLYLGLITPQERSLLSLVGLVNGPSPAEAVPLAFSGSGTTQMALFVLAWELFKGEPVIVLDEPEAGLEPYRQRRFVKQIEKLIGTSGQAFMTTHSPAVLSVLKGSQVTRIMQGEKPIALDNPHLDLLLKQTPSAFLAKLPILPEGATEVGLLEEVLHRFATDEGMEGLDALGVELVHHEGLVEGQPHVLNEAKAMLDAGFACSLFVDNEDTYSGTRAALREREQCAFGSWHDVRCIEEALAKWLPFQQLPELVQLASTLPRSNGLVSLYQELGEQIGKPGKASVEELSAEFSEDQIRDALSTAMVKGRWFKSREGGRCLGRFLLERGTPPEIHSIFAAFWVQIKRVLNWG